MPELKKVAITALQRGRYQPRHVFAETELTELAESIRAAGLIQPIVIRPLEQAGRYEIVAGERRWRAAQLAKLSEVNCLVHHYSDEQAAAVATIENVNRVDLNPIEEAEAYHRLYQEFAYSHEEIAAIVGKSRAKISNMLRLLKLDARVQDLLQKRSLTEGHGKIILSLEQDKQYAFARRCVQQGWSVRRAEKELKKLTNAPVDTTHADVNIDSLKRALSDHVGCEVGLDFNAGRCAVQINCHNLEVLQGLFDKLGFKDPLSLDNQ